MKLFEGNPIGRRNAGLSPRSALTDALQAALAYQAAGAAVVVGGVKQSAWTQVTSLSGGVSGRSAVSPGTAVIHPTHLTSITMNNGSSAAVTGKIILFRWNGASWDAIKQQSVALTDVAGALTVTLDSPWAALDGDALGLYLPGSGKVWVNNVSALAMQYDGGDKSTAGATFASSMAFDLDIEASGHRPYIALAGDSIFGGKTLWQQVDDGYAPNGSIHTVPGGDPDYSLSRMFGRVNAVNRSRGSTTWAYASTAWANAMLSDPHTVVLGFGVNDVAQARTWPQVEADLDSVKALWTSSSVQRLFMTEILPYSGGSDGQAATIRTWNANYATWCAANGVQLIEIHDAMAQTRMTTGELDDLLAVYAIGDGTHLSAAGMAALGRIVRAALGL